MNRTDKALSVSELTRRISSKIDQIGRVWVEGEVSGFTRHSSQHWYFDIKDNKAVLACAMFRGSNRSMTWMPKVGDKICISGELGVFARRGTYNIRVLHMTRSGVGEQLLRLEALRKKLMAEGLFAPENKRPLPSLPQCVGVATALTGAAFQDIREVLHERYPNLTIFLAPCTVQGEHAPQSIVAAIELLNRHAKSDVLIIGRGGGSAEDLMPFSDEAVVRAVAASQIPVICAVGHEVDHSLSDLAADRRAATPSHAAELAVPVKQELLIRIAQYRRRTLNAIQSKIRYCRQQILALQPRDPRQRLVEGRLRCDDLTARLERALEYYIERKKNRARRVMAQLNALSPLAVLSRGYAVVTQRNGQAITDSYQLRTGQKIKVRFDNGQITAKVHIIHEQAEQLKLL